MTCLRSILLVAKTSVVYGQLLQANLVSESTLLEMIISCIICLPLAIATFLFVDEMTFHYSAYREIRSDG